jgi:RpiB/LacA/LacB family sugar-phosphate isomerase
MRVGIASDHGGFTLKGQMAESLRASGYEVVDFGAHQLDPGDDYPDFIIPLARAVDAGEVERGVALCGSGGEPPSPRAKFVGCVRGSSMMFSPLIRASRMTA